MSATMNVRVASILHYAVFYPPAGRPLCFSVSPVLRVFEGFMCIYLVLCSRWIYFVLCSMCIIFCVLLPSDIAYEGFYLWPISICT